MSKKRIFVGVKKLHYALLLKDNSTGVLYTKPSLIIGTVNVNIQDTTNSNIFYADDAPFDITTTYGGAKITIETAGLSPEIQAILLGHKYEDGVLKMNASDKPPYVALLFESEMSTGAVEFVKLLKGKFQIPSATHATKTDNPSPNAITIEGDFVVRDFDGFYRYIAHSDEVETDNWYDFVESAATTIITPNLSVSATSLTLNSENSYSGSVTVSRSGNGAISVSSNNAAVTFSISDTTITVTGNNVGLTEDFDAILTVNVAADENYSSDTAVIAVTVKKAE